MGYNGSVRFHRTPECANHPPSFRYALETTMEDAKDIKLWRVINMESPVPGISLRDWFAGQALVGLITQGVTIKAAETAYKIADGMLKEKAQTDTLIAAGAQRMNDGQWSNPKTGTR
jgi:hypothetical protein